MQTSAHGICRTAKAGGGRRGFTLIELLVVLGIVMIMASVALVSFSTLTRGRVVRKAASGLKAVIWQARNYAASHNVYAVVRFYSHPEACAEMYMLPMGTALEDVDFASALTRRVVKRHFLGKGVAFADGSNPVDTLYRPDGPDGIIELRDGQASTLVFGPAGGLRPVSQLGLTGDNIQIGLVPKKKSDTGEKMAVTVLFASGIPYIEDAQ